MLRLNKSRLAAIAVLMASFTLLLVGVVTAADTKGVVAYRVTPGTISISIADPTFAFGLVDANTTVICPDDIVGACPTVDNTGSQSPQDDITSIVVSFDNAAEATCTSGTWDAVTSSPGEDEFALNVDIDGSTYVNISPNPFSTSGNIIVDDTFFFFDTPRVLNFQLVLPLTVTTTGECRIVMTVTAS